MIKEGAAAAAAVVVVTTAELFTKLHVYDLDYILLLLL
jgi:hypothetical protein